MRRFSFPPGFAWWFFPGSWKSPDSGGSRVLPLFFCKHPGGSGWNKPKTCLIVGAQRETMLPRFCLQRHRLHASPPLPPHSPKPTASLCVSALCLSSGKCDSDGWLLSSLDFCNHHTAAVSKMMVHVGKMLAQHLAVLLLSVGKKRQQDLENKSVLLLCLCGFMWIQHTFGQKLSHNASVPARWTLKERSPTPIGLLLTSAWFTLIQSKTSGKG